MIKAAKRQVMIEMVIEQRRRKLESGLEVGRILLIAKRRMVGSKNRARSPVSKIDKFKALYGDPLVKPAACAFN